ncbi:hypothetical protein BCS98_04910 [Vibrio breoganii]|uniref:glycosyltransferase n=1 Tax=Vibrio breoganii TaxID=553239 RepID=UPI000C826FB7|nr:glycosyltransferase [Vibrio breoganii]PMO94260.1 hypothetical protein BCS98_04910 [Vibrio breoganii]
MKYCCGVTTYYPSSFDVQNIIYLANSFEKVYVYDNTPGGMNDNFIALLKAQACIEVMSNSQNDGLSQAFQTFYQLSLNRYDFVCLLDQDSRLLPKDIHELQEIIQQDKDESVAIYAPAIQYTHKSTQPKEDKIEQVHWAISSGSFIRITSLQQTNGFDQNYFIDKIDLDLGTTLTELGHKIKIARSIILEQKLGATKTFMGLQVFQHSAERNYYIARNRHYYYKKHRTHFRYATLKATLGSIKQLLSVFICQDDKLAKVQSIVSGFEDHKKKKYGKR